MFSVFSVDVDICSTITLLLSHAILAKNSFLSSNAWHSTSCWSYQFLSRVSNDACVIFVSWSNIEDTSKLACSTLLWVCLPKFVWFKSSLASTFWSTILATWKMIWLFGGLWFIPHVAFRWTCLLKLESCESDPVFPWSSLSVVFPIIVNAAVLQVVQICLSVDSRRCTSEESGTMTPVEFPADREVQRDDGLSRSAD